MVINRLCVLGLISSIFLLVACGGGSSATEESDSPPPIQTDDISPTGTIIFPPSLSITEASRITIRGTAEDNESLTSVSVNDVDATTPDSYTTWEASVPLEYGENMLTVTITDTAGNTNASMLSVNVRRETFLQYPKAITVNQQTNEAILVDAYTVMSINLETGERATILQKPNLPQPVIVDVEIDNDSQKVFTFDQRLVQFEEIDLVSDEQRIIDGRDSDSNLDLVFNEDFVLDIANGRFLSVDVVNGSVISVNISTGDKSVLFENFDGTTPIGTITGVDYDSGTNTIFMSEFNFNPSSNNLLKLDLNTGVLTTVASDISDGGVTDLKLDLAKNRALMSTLLTATKAGVIATDLSSGVTTNLSNDSISSIDFLTRVKALTIDDTNNQLLALDDKIDGIIAVSNQTGEQELVFNSKHSIPNTDNQLNFAKDLVLDKNNNRVIVIDEVLGLIAINLSDGQRSIISDARDFALGSVNAINPVDIELDETNDRVLVLDTAQRSVIAIALQDGQRTLLYDGDSTAPSNLLESPSSMVFDSDANILYIEDLGAKKIVEISVDSGEQKLLAEYEQVGLDSADLVLDKSNNRLYVGGSNGNELISTIALGSGEVQQLVSNSDLNDFILDLENNRAYIVNSNSSLITESERGALSSYSLTTNTVLELVTPDFVSKGFVNGDVLDFDKENNKIYMFNQRVGALYLIDLSSGQAVIISS